MKKTAVVLIGVILVGAFFLAKYHIVQSSEGTRIIPKVHLTFSETFVSLDAITTMPYLQAKSEHPLAILALQREGFIETDAEFNARIKREIDAEMREAEAKVQRQTDALRLEALKAQAEAQRQMNDLMRAMVEE